MHTFSHRVGVGVRAINFITSFILDQIHLMDHVGDRIFLSPSLALALTSVKWNWSFILLMKAKECHM